MKTTKLFPSIILFFAFLLLAQMSFAQGYSPLQIAELELSNSQKEQLKKIDKDFSQKQNELYKLDENGSRLDYTKIRAQRKLNNDLQKEARLKVLTKEQLEEYEGYVAEMEADPQARKINSRMLRLENQYPGIEITYDQVDGILEREEEVRLNADGEGGRSWRAVKKAEKEIYREVMDETQFAIYDAIEKEKIAIMEMRALEEIKKALPVAEEMIPMLEEFTLAKFKVLRNKLEVKISDADKRELANLRIVRAQQFDEMLEKEFYPELNDLTIENSELKRYADFCVDLFETNKSNAVNLFPGNMYGGSDEADLLKKLNKKYLPEIDNMEAEMLWLIKETVKKGAVIASQEYPVPPVALILNEIKDVPSEIKTLFLLLDPEMDFSMDLPNFEKGEGAHFASAFPNPAKKSQTLEFYLPQDDQVTIEILDESGRTVKNISSENMSMGKHTLEVDIQNLNTQLYFYRITTGEKVTMIKFTVVK